MVSVAKKIKRAWLEKDMNQTEFCKKTGRNDGNFSKQLAKDNFKIQELESIANDLDYDLKISFVDRTTGEEF